MFMRRRIIHMLVCFIVALPLQLNAATSYVRSQALLDKLDQKNIRMNLWRQRTHNALTQTPGAQKKQSARAQANQTSEAMIGVIVSFDQLRHISSQTNTMQKGQRKQAARLQHQQDLGERQNALTRDLKASDYAGLKKFRGIKKFKYTSAMAITVNRSTLEALVQNPFITVTEDKLYKMFLDQSVPIVYPSHATSVYTGNNEWAVAIIDSGVDTGHPFLAGKVISEACYSSVQADNPPFEDNISTCPGEVAELTGPGSGEACDSSFKGCSHGTHVAGVAVGNGTALTPQQPDGVARTGKIISIKVVSLFDDIYSDRCSGQGLGNVTKCAVTSSSDVILGLERVFELRNDFKIAAVNLSAGIGLEDAFCDDNSNPLPEQQIIADLKSVGIATVVASGNGGDTGKIAFPACLSDAIAVGSSTNNDGFSSFSNSSEALDFYAPGENVDSSVLSPQNGYGLQELLDSSTSVAAAHAAGAWAVVKSKNPGASVDEIEALFDAHGPDITVSGETRKRIDLDGVLGDPNSAPSDSQFFVIRAKNGNIAVILLD